MNGQIEIIYEDGTIYLYTDISGEVLVKLVHEELIEEDKLNNLNDIDHFIAQLFSIMLVHDNFTEDPDEAFIDDSPSKLTISLVPYDDIDILVTINFISNRVTIHNKVDNSLYSKTIDHFMDNFEQDAEL